MQGSAAVDRCETERLPRRPGRQSAHYHVMRKRLSKTGSSAGRLQAGRDRVHAVEQGGE